MRSKEDDTLSSDEAREEEQEVQPPAMSSRVSPFSCNHLHYHKPVPIQVPTNCTFKVLTLTGMDKMHRGSNQTRHYLVRKSKKGGYTPSLNIKDEKLLAIQRDACYDIFTHVKHTASKPPRARGRCFLCFLQGDMPAHGRRRIFIKQVICNGSGMAGEGNLEQTFFFGVCERCNDERNDRVLKTVISNELHAQTASYLIYDDTLLSVPREPRQKASLAGVQTPRICSSSDSDSDNVPIARLEERRHEKTRKNDRRLEDRRNPGRGKMSPQTPRQDPSSTSGSDSDNLPISRLQERRSAKRNLSAALRADLADDTEDTMNAASSGDDNAEPEAIPRGLHGGRYRRRSPLSDDDDEEEVGEQQIQQEQETSEHDEDDNDNQEQVDSTAPVALICKPVWQQPQKDDPFALSDDDESSSSSGIKGPSSSAWPPCAWAPARTGMLTPGVSGGSKGLPITSAMKEARPFHMPRSTDRETEKMEINARVPEVGGSGRLLKERRGNQSMEHEEVRRKRAKTSSGADMPVRELQACAPDVDASSSVSRRQVPGTDDGGDALGDQGAAGTSITRGSTSITRGSTSITRGSTSITRGSTSIGQGQPRSDERMLAGIGEVLRSLEWGETGGPGLSMLEQVRMLSRFTKTYEVLWKDFTHDKPCE
ncbi:hypothetical protein GUITHDRAFT_122202 [Guillardia theta CCMP2712]|uniref:Uncharacterized protein n=1 Tax=Guillardia theta (strain CCMP2712) TaxID=905079 RepID=L1I6V6_GUITC|nr:hypothetical protein GUITHDRAFT_122202 [Guillardia theta CCMP2712]EKX31619.1 hypothetical protein GUITHDRAFT_122202 [Guillardia theta CCMP2712]|eukprot:XP_005818599.1 hypothetical protein GUITHDRAFT_122202 [Guillardia theta CCMP2712]